MKKMKAYAKTTLCIAMSAAMLFMDMGVSVSAAEYIQQEEESQQTQESQDKDFEEADSTETAETETATLQATAGEERTEETTEDIKTEEMTPEEVLTEELSEELSMEEAETETEVEESVQEPIFSGTDIAHGEYTEKGSNITWVIEKNGKLTVEGTGDFEIDQQKPWHKNAKDITSAVIKITGVRNAGNMFDGCENLKSVDVSDWNMSIVTDMSRMFWDCRSLTSIDASSWNIGSVTNMSEMFYNCESLKSVNLHGCDTRSVTDMSKMFMECDNLTSLDFSGLNMSHVTNMSEMLSGCSNLTSVNFSGCDTSNVKNMREMFYHCMGLTGLDLKDFNTSSVINMSGMFSDCFNLKSVDISSFNTRSVTDMNTMFFNCESLTGLDISGFDTSNVYDMQYMFGGCYRLTSLDLSSFDAKRVTQGTGLVGTDTSYALTKINTPRNLNVSVALDGNWYDAEGNAYTELPKGRADSILLSKNTKPESTKAYIAAQKTKTIYVCGEILNTDDITVMYYGADGTMKKLAQTEYTTNVSEISMKTAGDKTLTVTYKTSGGEALSADILIIVKDNAKISGIEIKDSIYNKAPVSYTGTAKVEAGGKDLTKTVKLTYTYSGTQADGSAYTATQNAPVNAGTYKLTVAVAEDDKNCAGSVQYSFTIAKTSLTVTARDIGLKIGAPLPQQKDYKYDIAGLFEGDSLITEPTLTCNIASTAKAETYDITVSGANAGMNYAITYQKGTLTVSEINENAAYYNVTFSLSGHGSSIINTGIKEGSLMKKPQTPQVKGYIFTGWYKDQSCTVLWDFDKDTVQSDTTIYAGWTANDTGDGDDKDDSPYSDSERTDLASVKADIAAIKGKVYDGNAYEPVVKVTATIDGKKVTLTEGADYRVLYQDNTDAGEGKVTVKGNGIYKGQIDKNFTISKKSIKKLKIITGSMAEADPKNNLSKLPIYVYDGTNLLELNKDYTLSDYKPVKATVAQVTVTAADKSNYFDSSVAKLTVYDGDAKIINPENIKLEKEVMPYSGKAVKPEVTVSINGALLTSKDYKVRYQNNIDAGTAFVIVTGKGEYKGTAVVPFIIQSETVTASNGLAIKPISEKTYNGKLQKPSVSVSMKKDGKEKKLSKKDYTVAYENNFHAGEATVIVTGKGNYADLSVTAKFTINPQDLKKASLKGTQDNITLVYNKRNLKEETDYEKPVYGEVNKNKVQVTIKGKGDFTGEMTKIVKVQ